MTAPDTQNPSELTPVSGEQPDAGAMHLDQIFPPTSYGTGEALDSIGQPIHTEPAAPIDQAPDHLKDSVGNHVGVTERAAESPATVIVEDETVPISVNAVAAIRDLTFRLAAPDAAIGSQIRRLLP